VFEKFSVEVLHILGFVESRLKDGTSDSVVRKKISMDKFRVDSNASLVWSIV